MNIKQTELPFQILEEAIISPIAGRELSETEEFISILLLDASSEQPIKTDEIIERLKSEKRTTIGFRALKKIIRSLRRDQAFPILTRRAKPAGYFWCRSTAEMEQFAKLWQSQYFDEMKTLSIMLKANYPKLAGQMQLPSLAE